MPINLLDIINPIKVCVSLTLLYALATLKWKNTMHRYVLSILWLLFFTELINSILTYEELSIRIPFYVSVVIHDALWMVAFKENSGHKKPVKIVLKLFLLFSVINFIIIEVMDAYNYFTFVFGALCYVSLFIYESYKELQEERLLYFVSNNYLLLFAPVFFFFGLGLMLGFKSMEVTGMLVFNKVTLYEFIVNIVCIAYYSLINIYIYREKPIRK